MSKPLKVTPAASTNGSGLARTASSDTLNATNGGGGGNDDDGKPPATPVKQSATKPEDISSPHELTAYVETLLSQLETRFDDMSSQILDRMNQMSSRVDNLENAIHDLINGDIARPATPSTPGVGGNGAQKQGSMSDSGS